jgi:hypothetical protein
MTDNVMVVLQNYMELLKVVPGSHSDTRHASRDENQVINIKVEYVIDIQEEEEDPALFPFPVIKAEYEVSCMSVCTLLVIFHMYADLPVVFLISI